MGTTSDNTIRVLQLRVDGELGAALDKLADHYGFARTQRKRRGLVARKALLTHATYATEAPKDRQTTNVAGPATLAEVASYWLITAPDLPWCNDWLIRIAHRVLHPALGRQFDLFQPSPEPLDDCPHRWRARCELYAEAVDQEECRDELELISDTELEILNEPDLATCHRRELVETAFAIVLNTPWDERWRKAVLLLIARLRCETLKQQKHLVSPESQPTREMALLSGGLRCALVRLQLSAAPPP